MKRLPESEYERVLRYAKSDKLSPYERRNGLKRRIPEGLPKGGDYDVPTVPDDYVWKIRYLAQTPNQKIVDTESYRQFWRPTEFAMTLKKYEASVPKMIVRMTGYEQCLSCREWKPRKEFSPRGDKLNGLQSYCKACKADGERKRRAA